MPGGVVACGKVRLGVWAAVVAVVSVACGGQVSLDGYDESEVVHLEDLVSQYGEELSADALRQTLRFRDDCRIILDALEQADRGGEVITPLLESLPDRVRYREAPANGGQGPGNIASIYEQMIDDAEMGDVSRFRTWAASSCDDVVEWRHVELNTVDPACGPVLNPEAWQQWQS